MPQHYGLLEPDPERPPATLQDSLQVLVGGGVPVHRSNLALEAQGLPFRGSRALQGLLGGGSLRDRLGAMIQGWQGGQLRGAAWPGGENRVFLRPEGWEGEEQQRYTAMHEFGHVSDFREVFPQAYKAIAEAYGPLSEREMREVYADEFAQAMRFLQGPRSREDNQWRYFHLRDMTPERKAMVRDLLRHPLYADHPLAKQGLLEVKGKK